MDPATLLPVLGATLVSDNATRRAAEAQLRQLSEVPGFLLAMLRVITAEGVPIEVLLQAGIQFKNIVARGWQNMPDHPSLWAEPEKAPIRDIVIEAAMIPTNLPLLVSLSAPISYIANEDFPDRWPGLIPTLLANLSSGDPRRIHNITFVIRYLVKKFEYKDGPGRIPLDMIITHVFPVLFNLFKALMPLQTLDAARLMKCIVKTYWSATQYSLGTVLCQPESLGTWLEVLNGLLLKRLPEASEGAEPLGQPVDLDDREAWPWWKLKKWCIQVIVRICQRFGVPKFVPDELRPTATFLSTTVSPQLLPSVLGVLALRASGQFCARRVLMLALQFVTNCLELVSTYKLVKPHIPNLLWQVVLPVLSYDARDHEQWTTDPEEYVRSRLDAMDALIDPRTSATEFVINLLKLRAKDNLDAFWKALNARLTAYDATPVASRNVAEKEGLMYMLGVPYEALHKSKKYKKQIEMALARFVMPELDSPVGCLRARACWTFAQYAEVKFASAATLTHGIHGVIRCLKDPEIPVRFMAGSVLRFVLRNDACHEIILPILPSLLDTFFSMLGELGVEDIVSSLEMILQRFSEELATMALPLVVKLGETFFTYCKDNGAEEDEDDELSLAAYSCLEAVLTVLEGVQARPEVYELLEPVLCSMVERLLDPEGEFLEYFENTLSILGYMSLHAPLTPRVWNLFLMMMTAFHKYAFDYLGEMLLPIFAFVSRGTDTFLTGDPSRGVNFLDMLWKANQKIEDSASEVEMATAAALFWIVLHHCKGRVDEFATASVVHFLGQMSKAHLPDYKAGVCGVICMAIIYNPNLALKALQDTGATEAFFKFLLETVPHFKSQSFASVGAISICVLMRLIPSGTLPVQVTSIIPDLLKAEVAFLMRLDAIADGDESEEEGEEDEEEEDDDEGLPIGLDGKVEGVSEDEDAHDSEEEEYMASLAKLKAKAERARRATEGNMEGFISAGAGDGGDDDDGFDEDEEYFGKEFQLPYTDAHPFVYFFDTFAGLSATHGPLLASVQAALDPDTRSLVQEALEGGKKQKDEGQSGEL